MEIVAYGALIVVLSYLLVKSADQIEDTFVLLAKKLGISTFIIGFVILGIVSSLPEASVAVSSAIDQVPQLSIGNILGANLILLTLVVALNTFVHKKIPFKGSFGRFQVILALTILTLGIGVLLDGDLNAYEGILLITSYVGFIIYITYNANHSNIKQQSSIKVKTVWNLLIRSMLGLVGLLVFSTLIVHAAVDLAGLLSIPETVVGLLVIALGTNIPELTILFRSKGAEQEKMAVGNFLGSACVNVGILGLLGILKPHQIQDFTAIVPIIVILILAILLFGILAWTGKEITRREGVILLGAYIALLIVEGITIYQASL